MLPLFHTLYFEATRRCNFSCEHCSSGSNGKIPVEEDLDYNVIVERILKPARELGTKYIEFSGGEFLLRKDAYDILKVADNSGFRIGIASNGSTISEKTIGRLKTVLGDNLLISLGINSFDEENKNTRFTGASYFESKLRLIEQYNVKCNIAVTMGNFNSPSFGRTLEKLRSLHLPFNRIPFVPRHSSQRDFMFDKDTLKTKLHPELIKSFHGFVSFIPFFLDPSLYEKHSGQNPQNSPVPTNPSVGCWCGSFYSITPAGEVAPCPLLGDHVSGGNVLQTPLKDILYGSEVFKGIVNRNNLKGKCGSCRFRFTCGGCRAYAYFFTGDIFGEDPTCFIDELSESEIEEIEKTTYKNFRNFVRMAKFGGIFKAPEENNP